MRERMIARAEQIARRGQEERIQRVAAQLRAVFGSASFEVDEAQVLIRGRGLIKRWLIEPGLRFIGGGLK